jgi:hypothetical protein
VVRLDGLLRRDRPLDDLPEQRDERRRFLGEVDLPPEEGDADAVSVSLAGASAIV